MKIKHFLMITALSSALISTSCISDTDDPGSSGNGQELFFSFDTPDWERSIPCDKIDFLPTNEISAGVAYVMATSASTNSTFVFPFPADSSAMVLPSNIKKYSISGYNSWGDIEGKSFEIALKLNKTGINDSNRIFSVAGYSDGSYNEVTSIAYIGSEANYANFLVKGNYKMDMVDPVNTSDVKQVTGSYSIKFRTHKK